MTLASHELAAFLGTQLARIAPEGVVVNADGPDVVVSSSIGDSRNGMPATLDVDDGRPLAERVEIAARAVLDHVQDAVALAAGEPWPGAEASLPIPGLDVVGRRLRSWFGDRQAPVVVLDELELSARC